MWNYEQEKYNELITLNSEEKSKIKEKLEIYEKFMDIFSNSVRVSSTILRGFTLKESLSKYCEIFISHLIKKQGFSTAGLFSTFSDDLKMLTKSEKVLAMLRLIELHINVVEKENYYRNSLEDVLNFCKGFLPANIIFTKLCESGAIESIHSMAGMKIKLQEYIDEAIVNQNIEDVSKFMEYVNKYFPDYKNFPLIINNENVSRETRIEILKKTYRQKDLPSYINLIEKNLKDLNTVDDFIESTVIQNNRVSEKEAGIIKVFKYIFLKPYYHYWRQSSQNQNEILNIKPFAEKYKKYLLDVGFMTNLYNTAVDLQTNRWERQAALKRFVKTIASKLNADESLSMLALIGNFVDIDREIEDIIRENFVNGNYENLKKVLLTLRDTALKTNKHKDILNKSLNLLKLINETAQIDAEERDSLVKFILNEIFEKIEIIPGKLSKDCFSRTSIGIFDRILELNLPIQNILKIRFVATNQFISGGITVPLLKIENLYMDTKDATSSVLNYLKIIEMNSESKYCVKDSLSEFKAFADKYIRIFEDEDICDKMSSSLFEWNETQDDIKYEIRWRNRNSNTKRTLENLIDNIRVIINIGTNLYNNLESYFPDEYNQANLEKFRDNIESRIDNISLLLAL